MRVDGVDFDKLLTRLRRRFPIEYGAGFVVGHARRCLLCWLRLCRFLGLLWCRGSLFRLLRLCRLLGPLLGLLPGGCHAAHL